MKRLFVSLIILILLFGVLGAFAFLFLNFRIARSQTNAGYNSSTASAGESMPASMQGSPMLSIAVLGDKCFSRALRSALQEQLQNSRPAYCNLLAIDTADEIQQALDPLFQAK